MNKDQKLLEEAYQSIYESNKKPLYFGSEQAKTRWMMWLSKLKHEVHEDGSVSVDECVALNSKNLTRIPFNFKSVKEDFDCSYNTLTSLEGAPNFVGRDFDCSSNNLRSLEGAPEVIKGKFYHDNFSDEDYRKYVKTKQYVDKNLEKEFDIDLEDF
jgi:hypothetical protein